MKFHYGSLPENPDFHPLEDGWHGIKEPGPVAVQFMAVPVAILCVGGLVLILFNGRPGLDYSLSFNGLTLVLVLLLFPVHELLHAFGFPRLGFTPETIIGVWPSRMLLYAAHKGALAKGRYLLVFTLPMVVLSVLPVAVLAWVRPLLISPEWISNLIMVAITNAAAGSGDVIGFFLVLFQIPNGALVKNQGWKTFWKAK